MQNSSSFITLCKFWYYFVLGIGTCVVCFLYKNINFVHLWFFNYTLKSLKETKRNERATFIIWRLHFNIVTSSHKSLKNALVGTATYAQLNKISIRFKDGKHRKNGLIQIQNWHKFLTLFPNFNVKPNQYLKGHQESVLLVLIGGKSILYLRESLMMNWRMMATDN